ncbi:MAG: hypothetical protein LBG48_03295 [Rickettsiales bacterium]|jgi:rhamnosyltransferase|nr:hypothetical protein [Rickettsiales bacterium]
MKYANSLEINKYYTKSISINKNKKFEFNIIKKFDQSINNKKFALFAHYDINNIIDDYVFYYINELSKLEYNIILITSNTLQYFVDTSIISSIIIRKGKGYDFTNWACAFAAYPELFSANEILLCNDSVFGPINPIKPIHDVMNSKDCDFWGLSDNQEITPHIQSYYMVFKKNAVQSSTFKDIFSANYVNTREEAIFIESNLTTILFKAGLKPFSYVSYRQMPINKISYVHYFWKPLIKWCGFPFIKRNLLTGLIPWIDTSSWQNVLTDKHYNINLILNYLLRIIKR